VEIEKKEQQGVGAERLRLRCQR